MHEYSIVQALLERVEQRGARARRAPRRAAPGAPRRARRASSRSCSRTAFETFRERTVCEGAPIELDRVPARGCAAAATARIARRAPLCAAATRRRRSSPATRSCSSGSRWRCPMCETCGCGDSEDRPGRRPRAHPRRQRPARAGTTASTSRTDGVLAINLMGSPGCGQDRAARGDRARARAARAALGAVSGDLATDHDARAPARGRHPVASRSRRARRATSTPRWCTTRCTTCPGSDARLPLHRERRQPRVPGDLRPRPGGERRGAVGDRGRGQAAQVPGDVPHADLVAAHQDRPAAAPADVDVDAIARRARARDAGAADDRASPRERARASTSGSRGSPVCSAPSWAPLGRARRHARPCSATRLTPAYVAPARGSARAGCARPRGAPQGDPDGRQLTGGGPASVGALGTHVDWPAPVTEMGAVPMFFVAFATGSYSKTTSFSKA